MLLDTQVWLWWNADDTRLGPGARKAIRNADEVHFSVASAWEIGIKAALGKLELPSPLNTDLERELAEDGFRPLPIELQHALRVTTLPMIHRDPFDRMLVAQALSEDLTLVTADANLMRYPVATLAGDG